MKIYVHSKRFFKESKETQKTILDAMHALYDRIHDYEKVGTAFEQIFNDDKVKYDQQGEFFVYKSARSNLQLRILYAYFSAETLDEKLGKVGIESSESILLIEDHFIKKKNNKEYLRQFEYAKALEAAKCLEESKQIGGVE